MFKSLIDALESDNTHGYVIPGEAQTPTPMLSDKATQTSHIPVIKYFTLQELENKEVSKKVNVRSKGIQHRPISWVMKDATCSPWKVKTLQTNSPSPSKCESFQITSTPICGKRKFSEENSCEQSPPSTSSLYCHGRKKRKCARSLCYEGSSQIEIETSLYEKSTPKSDSSWHETSTSSITSNRLTSPLHCTTEFQQRSRQRVRELMESAPKIYLGIDRDWLSVLTLLSTKFKVRGCLSSLDVIYLVLRKIRLNESFAVIGHEFGISNSHAAKLFKRFLPFISDHLTDLIVWANDESIHRAMPIGFRKSFKKVAGIGDCLEISIQKPTDAFEQALTWSEYKKGNTIKYYVAISPNGLFMFCSVGYGGRATDELIFSHSGFLDKLKEGMHIMVDRGFKKIESMVLQKGCVIVRPPSVNDGKQLTKQQVLTGRKIAGVRIHVERAIRRIREFKFLAPHACVQHSLVHNVDDAISLVCGLINLQSCLIRC